MPSKNFTASSLTFTIDTDHYPTELGTFDTSVGNVGAMINGVPIIDFAWNFFQAYLISYTTTIVDGRLQYQYNGSVRAKAATMALDLSTREITYTLDDGGYFILTYTEHSDYVEFEITDAIDSFGDLNEIRLHFRTYDDTTVLDPLSSVYKSGGGEFEDFDTTTYANGRIYQFHDSEEEYLFCCISNNVIARFIGNAPYVETRFYDENFVPKPGYQGLIGNKWAIFAAKLNDCPDIIAKIESNFGISPGIEEKLGSNNKENVLFAYDINETNVSSIVSAAKDGGFKKVMFIADSWFNTLNNDLNTNSFSSLSALQSAVSAFAAEGIDCGAHLLPTFITAREVSSVNNILFSYGYPSDDFMFAYPDHRIPEDSASRVKLNQTITSSDTVTSINILDFRDGLQSMTSLTGQFAVCQINNEFFSFGSITRNSAGDYTLNSVTRNKYSTELGNHAINDLVNFPIIQNNDNAYTDLLVLDPFKPTYKNWLNLIAQRFVDIGFKFVYLDSLELDALPLIVYPDTTGYGLTLFDQADVLREFCDSVITQGGEVQFTYGSALNGNMWHNISRSSSIDYNHYDETDIDQTVGLVHSGTALSGNANSITLDVLASSIDDAYIRNVIYIQSGTGSTQWRYISSYDGETKIATVSVNWSVQPNSTSQFLILKSIDSSGYSLLQKHVNEISDNKNITESYKSLFVPFDFGWYRPRDATTPTLWEWDAFEANYLMSKIVGNDAVLTMTWYTDYEDIQDISALLDICKQWHRIKINGSYGTKFITDQNKTDWSNIESDASDTSVYLLMKTDFGYAPQLSVSSEYEYPLVGYQNDTNSRGIVWIVGLSTYSLTINPESEDTIVVDYQGVFIPVTRNSPITFVVNRVIYFYPTSSASASLNNINPENVFFCYRSGDQDSIDVADHYKITRLIPDENIIELPCSDDLIISKSDYESTIENVILTAISNSITEIYVIILGYKVPNIFIDDDGEKIACASRLHRIGHSMSRKYPNHTYDRKDFKYFDQDDSLYEKITAVIDGPDKDTAINLIDRGFIAGKQSTITGKLFIDPYGKNETLDQQDYQNDLAMFSIGRADRLGLTIVSTQEQDDPYAPEPIIIGLNNDSFYWGWYEPRYSKSLFYSSNSKRVFLYNADNDSASNIRQTLDQSDPWCCLASQVPNGYASSAGSIDSPGEDSYLRPEPFFEALHRGSTIGEAFLFSSQFVDWRIILIGDPLITVNFPDENPDLAALNKPVILEFKEGLRLITRALETSIAWRHRQTSLVEDIENYLVDQACLEEENTLFDSIDIWNQSKSATIQTNMLYPLLKGFLQFVNQSTGLDFATWLSTNNMTISQLLVTEIQSVESQEVFSDDQIAIAGSWDVDFIYEQTANELIKLFFVLEIATDDSFDDIIIVADNRTDLTGWEYEFDINLFASFPQTGFPSNYANVRRIRYTAPQENYLTTLEVYYARWIAYDSDNNAILSSSDDSGYHCIGRNLIIRN